MIFIFIKFTLNPSDFRCPIQASSCRFKPNQCQIIIKEQLFYTSWSHLNKQGFQDYDNKRNPNTKPWCFPATAENKHCKRINSNSTLSISIHWLHKPNQPLSHINFLKTYRLVSLETRSKAFSKSTYAKCKFFFLAKYFSCNCCKMKMTSAAPHRGIKPNCISFISTCCLINFLISLSTIFRNWSVNFSPL